MNSSKRVGEKTPNNIRYLTEILHMFPRRADRAHHSPPTRFDFVALALSLVVTLHHLQHVDVEDRDDVTRSISRMVCSKATAATSSLRYEDLVLEPERELRRLCDFLNITFAPEMLSSHQRADAVFQNEPWKEGALKPVNRQSVSAWHERLRPQQVALIEKVAANYATYGGYERHGSASSVSLAIEAFRDFCRYVPYKIRERFKARGEFQGDEKNWQRFIKALFNAEAGHQGSWSRRLKSL